MNLICGINPILEALGAQARHFDRLLVVKGVRNRRIAEIVSRGSKAGIPLRFEARETLDRMAGGVPHQGIIAVVSSKPLMGLEDLLGHLKDPALVVLLDGIEDPRNLGAILRTAEAAGVDGVLVPERHSAGLSETVARTSAGALEHVRVARVGNVVQAIQALKEKGLWLVGFDASGAERWDKVDLKKPVALVLGGESRGIRRLVREHCDHLVSLPLFGHVTSLNVSVAAGIALYEVIRQRGAVPSHVRPIPVGANPSAPRVTGPRPEDLELDPGAPPPSNGDLADEDEPMTLVDLDDEDERAAWALRAPGPAEPRPRPEHRRVIPVGGGRERQPLGRRGRRRGRRREDPRGPERPPAAAGEAQSPQPPQSPQPSQGQRRRRRRRRRRGGPPTQPSGA